MDIEKLTRGEKAARFLKELLKNGSMDSKDVKRAVEDAVTLNKLVRQVVHEEIGENGVRKITVEIHFNMRQPE